MKQKLIAAGLACVLTLSLTSPCLAIRVGSSGPQAAGRLESSQIVTRSYATLSFSEIRSRVLAGNLSIRSAKEGLAAAESMDLDKQFKDAIDDLDDAIDQMESAISAMSAAGSASPDDAVRSLQQALTSAEDGGINASALAQSISAISAASVMSTYSQVQAQSMKSNVDSLKNQKSTLEEQLDDLKEERDKQKKEYVKTLADTARQIDHAIDQTVSGAESLYLSILSTQLQLDALRDSQSGTARRYGRWSCAINWARSLSRL